MNDHVIFESSPLLLSQLIDGKFEKKWKHWATRILQIRADSTMVYRYNKDTAFKRKLDIKTINIVAVPVDFAAMGVAKGEQFEEVGVHIECNEDGYFTAIKCVISLKDLEAMLKAIRKVSDEHNIDEYIKVAKLNFSANLESGTKYKETSTNKSLNKAHSVMRRSIAHVVDVQNLRTRNERIVSRRGAFRWLPVAFTNDLVHGSWWYVLGSFFTVIFPIFIIVANYNSKLESLGYDDDILGKVSYDATWILMMVSGIFFTLGSMAFLRAVADPPMKPYFYGSYHFGTDELLGSWCFVCACLPFLPYSLIYLAAEPHSWIMYGLVGSSILALLGSFIFLANCYPSEEETHRQYILSMIECINCNNCCCSISTVEKHLQNDWLAGTWIIFWVTAFGTWCTFVMSIYALSEGNTLKIFTNICTFVDCGLFLIGSVYFVAGSYPDSPATQALIRNANGYSPPPVPVSAAAEMRATPVRQFSIIAPPPFKDTVNDDDEDNHSPKKPMGITGNSPVSKN